MEWRTSVCHQLFRSAFSPSVISNNYPVSVKCFLEMTGRFSLLVDFAFWCVVNPITITNVKHGGNEMCVHLLITQDYIYVQDTHLLEDIFGFKHDLGQKNYAPQLRSDMGSNSWPPDHDSTFYLTELTALTTWPSVTETKKRHDYLNSNQEQKERERADLRQGSSLAHIARIHNLASKHGDSDYTKYLINCSLYYCRAILKISPKSSHNV